MATQLGVINDTLSMLGDSEIAQSELTDQTRETARVLASAWPDAVDFVLSAAPWIFASRIVALTPFGEVGEQETYAAPGYSRAFQIPDDHLRTNWLRATPYPDTQPIRFVMQDGFWHADLTMLYASYVSHQYRSPDDWTPLFAKTVAAYLAFIRGPRIRPAADANELRLKYDAMMDQARTVDASEQPFAWHRTGRLVRSRGGHGDGRGYYDGFR